MMAQRIMRYIVNSTLLKFLNDGSRYVEFTLGRTDPSQERICVKEKLDFTSGSTLATKLRNFTTGGVYFNKFTHESYELTDQEVETYSKTMSGFIDKWKDDLVHNHTQIIRSIRNKTTLLMTSITICAIFIVWLSSFLLDNNDDMTRAFITVVTSIMVAICTTSAKRMSRQLDVYLNEITKELQ